MPDSTNFKKSTPRYNEEMVKMVEKRNHQLTIMEYRNEIHNHLVHLDFELEEDPTVDPVQDQVRVLRPSILNSLLDVCYRLSWSSTTFAMAVHLFDFYVSNATIEINNCRLAGFCCLWIASKYNENKPKGNILNALIKRAGYGPSYKKAFLKIEFEVLKTINWDLSYPTPELFIDLFLNTAEANRVEKRLGSLFLSDLALFNIDIVANYSSSSIAASSIMISCFAMLNLRHKHIRQHRFDVLESMILNQVVKMESSIRMKYLDNNVISHSNNNMVIHNIIYLAQCFVKQKEEEKEQLKKLKDMDLNPNSYYNSSGYMLNSKINENGNISFFPISPMASPTNLPHNSGIRTSLGSDSSQSPEHVEKALATGSSTNLEMLGHRHNRSLTLRGMLPTPGTTPTGSFNWLGTNTSNSSTSENPEPASSGMNASVDHQMKFQTPQIFTPVQLFPSNMYYPSVHNTHNFPYSHQRFSEYARSETPEMVSKNSRQKYHRTLPVLTRSRAKECISRYDQTSLLDIDCDVKRQRI
ncbi:hypothetical protein CANINC_001156 [Pichia inconspicua]|uniref:Cyclin-like domain-containing protein n=1 Tax=Pichia inconspicua TaxID=52247 RepID=A0A4T0X4B7_9ASCO|nr:hypothetical protein CANINC_001156 [[Candida] inconspicua]